MPERPAAEALPPPEELVRPGIEYLQGVVQQGQRLIMVVDLRRILSPAETAESAEPAVELWRFDGLGRRDPLRSPRPGPIMGDPGSDGDGSEIGRG